jgi:hypothetical protein
LQALVDRQPRGVALTHRGLANHVIAATELYGIGPTIVS